MATPIGEMRTLATPHTAAGPSLRQVALGSEGVLGVITEVSVRVRPVPAARRYEAWVAADFASACDQVRELAQSDRLPDIVRISDESETRTSLALSGTSGAKRALLDAYLTLRRRRGGCIVICGWEGDPGLGRPPPRAGGAGPARWSRRRSANRPAERGSTVATRGHTCATS